MTKELFVDSINAIQKQIELNIEVSKHLGKAFPDAFEANLLPRNYIIQDALIHVLQVEMNDTNPLYSWINYFCYELDFGIKNDQLNVHQNGVEIKMSNAGELYDFLNNNMDII